MNKQVEQAKEAAGAAGQAIVDFFQGNPFGTPVGHKIELATDGSLVSENWGLNMEICDFINMTEEGPHDAVRALRKRLQTQVGRNNQTVVYTLTVLETCVKNCDRRFLELVLQRDFCQELVKIIGPKNDPPQVVQERVLGLIQCWADAFRQQDASLRGVCEVYDELKAKGLEFPPTDLDAMAPILTPKPTSPMKSADPVSVVAVGGGGSPERFVPPETPIEPTAEQLVQLRAQLDAVQGNMRVLREMLTELAPGQESTDDYQLLIELHHTLKKMQRRVMGLLQSVANEQVTAELLVVNDDLNHLFVKYDRYMTNRKAPDSQQAQDEKATPSSLIDLGPVGDVAAAGPAIALADQLNKLDVNEATTASKPPAAQAGDSKEQSGEFDMFAQTRSTTFEQSRQGGSSYVDNSVGVDQINVSLGAATQQKAEGPGVVPSDKPSDISEMDKWLKDGAASAVPVAAAGDGTTQEFDTFLQRRAADGSAQEPAKKSEEQMFGL